MFLLLSLGNLSYWPSITKFWYDNFILYSASEFFVICSRGVSSNSRGVSPPICSLTSHSGVLKQLSIMASNKNKTISCSMKQTCRILGWLCRTKSPFQQCLRIHAMLNFLKIYWTEQNFTRQVFRSCGFRKVWYVCTCHFNNNFLSFYLSMH